MRALFFIGALALATTGVTLAETSVTEALAEAEKDLQSALASLAEAQEEVAREKPEVSKEFESLAVELRDKRRLVRIARTSKQDREMVLRDLQREQQLRLQDASYVAGLLKDHALKVQTLSGPGEPALELDDAMIAAEADDPAQVMTDRLAVVGASLDRLESILGGSKSSGRAAGPDGKVITGDFAAMGPLLWFSGEGVSGGAVYEKGSNLAKIIPGEEQAVSALLNGDEASLGLDVTGGKARALEEIDGDVTDLIRKGGLWIWPIIGLAVLSFIFGLVKLISFMRYRTPSEAWVNAIIAALRSGDKEKAVSLASKPSHPVAPVMTKLVERSESTTDAVEEILYEQLMGVQQKAGSLLPIIAVTAATAPLLGLLGTVSGMIRTFNLITLFGSGDPKPLAGGISEALVTTLFGLIVAIPALVLHAFLARRSQGIVQTTERLGLSFVNSLRSK